jgi:hypothetical protein
MWIRMKCLEHTANKTLNPASPSPSPSHYTNWAIPVSVLVPECRIYSKILLVTDEISRRSSWPLKIGPISCPETSARNYHSTLRKIPKERRSHLHCGVSLKSRLDVYDITESVSKLWEKDNISSKRHIFTKLDTTIVTTQATQCMTAQFTNVRNTNIFVVRISTASGTASLRLC